MSDLISIIDNDFPDIRIDLKVQSINAVIDGVLDYRSDFGIIEGREDDSRLNQEPWCSDHLVIVGSPHHPFAKREHVSMAQLEQEK